VEHPLSAERSCPFSCWSSVSSFFQLSIFLSFSFFFFLLSFSFNSSLLLHSSGNRTAKLVPSPFCSRNLPESYLLLFFSPTFFLLFECVQPSRSCGKWPLPSIVECARTHRHITATTSVNFPVGEIQRKQTGAHDRPSVILERTCSTAENGHLDALSVQSSGRLIVAENKVQLFRVARS
jgi:hypothetical protein